MGFAGKQGFSAIAVDTGKPTLTLKGGGGKVTKTPAENTPALTLNGGGGKVTKTPAEDAPTLTLTVS